MTSTYYSPIFRWVFACSEMAVYQECIVRASNFSFYLSSHSTLNFVKIPASRILEKRGHNIFVLIAAHFTLSSRYDIPMGTSVQMTGAYHEGSTSGDRKVTSMTFSVHSVVLRLPR